MIKDLYKIYFSSNNIYSGISEMLDKLTESTESTDEYIKENKIENIDLKNSSIQVNVAGYSKQDIECSVKDKTLLLVNTNPYKSKLEVEINIPSYTKSIDIEIENGMATINFIPNSNQSIELNII